MAIDLPCAFQSRAEIRIPGTGRHVPGRSRSEAGGTHGKSIYKWMMQLGLATHFKIF